jgi:hypothetical protein
MRRRGIFGEVHVLLPDSPVPGLLRREDRLDQ